MALTSPVSKLDTSINKPTLVLSNCETEVNSGDTISTQYNKSDPITKSYPSCLYAKSVLGLVPHLYSITLHLDIDIGYALIFNSIFVCKRFTQPGS